MKPDKIDEFLASNPKICHDCGGSLAMACMVVIEGSEIFAVCRACAIKRDPNDEAVMNAVTAHGQAAAQQIAKRN